MNEPVYEPSKTVERIKLMRENLGISADTLKNQCDISKNTISKSVNSPNGLSARILYSIANALGCSSDYLLGMTDEPTARANNIITTGNVITTGNITPVASGENSTSNGIVIDSTAPAKDVAELVDLIQSLPLVKRAEAIVYMNNLKNNE